MKNTNERIERHNKADIAGLFAMYGMPTKKTNTEEVKPMKFAYQFVGGSLNNVTFTNANDAWTFSNGNSGDLSAIRNRGGLVRREELDNQPTFEGYLGPMWDGKRIKGTDGKWHHTFDTFTPADPEETMYVLRYESQKVYDMMNN